MPTNPIDCLCTRPMTEQRERESRDCQAPGCGAHTGWCGMVTLRRNLKETSTRTTCLRAVRQKARNGFQEAGAHKERMRPKKEVA